ncbi:hypothetical protein HanHA300_Chr16g0622511 [Helianthus annuus]|nr:hypothetical protein HanHA300_Chr16g0622511 [Helianthus annuus]KAJ0444213.1 hypothetical protein HanIR_Chr16g0829321 [Helianthus annuus]KAJ0461541.1 hypothetical protein HanHA89_Chr16g0673401 [Helianthus annuus]KAJ0641968.1 hypothetical protein HanLR1_Chr16g0633061 [Helianthus annuus]
MNINYYHFAITENINLSKINFERNDIYSIVSKPHFTPSSPSLSLTISPLPEFVTCRDSHTTPEDITFSRRRKPAIFYIP